MQGNPFVMYLDQFNTLSPNHSKIYDEYMLENDTVSYEFQVETKVEQTIIQKFASAPGHVILTGNAGDGKTRLCRTIYNHFSKDGKLEAWPKEGIVECSFDKGRLRIVKDLSELRDDIIERELTQLQSLMEENSEQIYYVIAANEGKLTKFLSQRTSLASLAEDVKRRFEDYRHNTTTLSIYNLLDVTSSIYLEKVLDEWNKEENWMACTACPRQKRCIIHLNHTRMKQPAVKRRMVEQYRLLDFLAIHLTMRELLIHMSYVFTGGYTCTDVLEANYQEIEQQIEKVYYQNFFGAGVSEGAFSEIKAFEVFSYQDPGKQADGEVDDFILNGDISGNEELEQTHLSLFNQDLDMYRGYFTRQLQRYRDHDQATRQDFTSWFPRLRRKIYFEFPQGIPLAIDRLIPYRYIQEYKRALEDTRYRKQLRKKIISGLNRTFSQRLVENGDVLYATNRNLLIYGKYYDDRVSVTVQEQREDIDHLPSHMFLHVKDAQLLVNLYIFEYLFRIANGGTFNLLKQETNILIDTFKNELIRISPVDDEEDLYILRLDPEAGEYVRDEISISGGSKYD
ncbi:hypothetical protein P4S93_09015 [Aneurinibacillus thermoaerophilus]|uniref:hypothetical protein n=1 Tax=Aneurinibacillus thermoaerophilus TaxID=143495 RepID=UPI002E2455E4|nr:hypothetical protein [Aneurinibacillus thermoaerophilus]MED0760917.1 hypothetical protein [Aneurinibacillus thermoaerophilus]